MIKKLLATGLIASTAITGMAACNTEPTKKDTGVSQGVGSKGAAKDVKLGKMTTPYGTVEIPATIHNHSDKPSDYNIEATVYDAKGNQVDTASLFVQRLAAHGKAHDKLVGLSGSKADHYKLTVVERTASL